MEGSRVGLEAGRASVVVTSSELLRFASVCGERGRAPSRPPGPSRGPGSWYTRLCPLSQAHVPAGLPCQLLASFSHKAGSPW